ncbi:MAG: hypothetical protein OIF51_18365 [Cellvibrionaceae bacterium]|nr:hypothetical protein [Cellvibrionaceae bacterium]
MDKLQQLKALGFGEIAHLNGSLLDHLKGTQALLQSWGASQTLCQAGLFQLVMVQPVSMKLFFSLSNAIRLFRSLVSQLNHFSICTAPAIETFSIPNLTAPINAPNIVIDLPKSNSLLANINAVPYAS